MDTWNPAVGITTLNEVARHLAPMWSQATGITISGGEPFDQPDALAELVRFIRSTTASNFDILVYSGYPFDSIRGHESIRECLIDALISDPFDREHQQSKPLRGSDNQQLHLLTELGSSRFAEYERARNDADLKLDVVFGDDGQVWFAGVPRRDDLFALKVLLKQKGVTISISQDQRGEK